MDANANNTIIAIPQNKPCQWCSNGTTAVFHFLGPCPHVKSIEYDCGVIRRVEFHDHSDKLPDPIISKMEPLRYPGKPTVDSHA